MIGARPPDRSSAATEALNLALADLDQAGATWPCRGRLEWTSEDLEDRRYVTRLCQGCPVQALCQAAATASKVTFGIWAAKDYGPPPRRPA